MELNKNQKMARMAALFSLTAPLTDEESKAINLPANEWPQSLRDKTPLYQLVANEDAMATEAQTPPATP